MNADQLWKGCTSVSNAGRKRGRAKGIGRKKDLNRGQIIGVGKTNMLWPGLNAPVIRGRELVKHQKLPDNPDWYDDTIYVCVCVPKNCPLIRESFQGRKSSQDQRQHVRFSVVQIESVGTRLVGSEDGWPKCRSAGSDW